MKSALMSIFFQIRYSERTANLPLSIMSHGVISRINPFRKIHETGRAEAHHISAFTAHSQSVEEICDSVASLCGRDGIKYIYTYWHQPDYDIHGLGTRHEQITADIRQINELIEKMCARFQIR